MKKRMLALFIILVLLGRGNMGYADKNVEVFIKGRILLEENILKNGVTFVPITDIAELLELDVESNAKDKSLVLKKKDIEIKLFVGKNKAYINGKEEKLKEAAFSNKGKIYLPLRYISEKLDEEVVWDEKNKVVIVGEYRENTDKKDTYLYYNKIGGYTLNLPNSWQKDVVLEEKEDRLNIYDRKTLERFKKDGDTCGPTLEIRISKSPIIADVPNDVHTLLSYDGENYIEASLDRDFQFYKETQESYLKVQKESIEILKTFNIIEGEDIFVEVDINNLEKEKIVLENILEKYLPKNIFNKDQIKGYVYPKNNNSLLYLANIDRDDAATIKIESDFDNNGELTRYRFKNYSYDIKEGVRKISQKEALELANKFVDDYVGEKVDLVKMPDLYPSLYEKDKHESYGDLDKKYTILVDLEDGFVEYFKINK